MNRQVNLDFKENFHVHSATVLLLLLLCADLMFFALHALVSFYPEPNTLYLLNYDKSYSEMFQYIKWFWIATLFVYLSVKRQSFHYGAWVLVFMYFLIDDSLRIHEQFGDYFGSNFSFQPPFGLRLDDVGELVITAIIGIVLLSLVFWAYIRGSQAFKKMSFDLLLLIVVLVFYGVIIDMVHSAIHPGWKLNFILTILEDGGEMLMASILCWYSFLLAIREDKHSSNLYPYIRSILTRYSSL